jgi:chitinase
MARRTLLALLVLLLVPFGAARPTFAATYVIYDDVLAAGWQNFSWATTDLQAAAPARGAAAISVTYGDTPPYQGLFLAHPDTSTTGYTGLRFAVHGGAAGRQLIQVYAKLADGTDGPKVALAPLAAGTWSEVQLPLADLGAANTTIAGITWQDRSGGSQPTFFVDDIALVAAVSPDGPVLADGGIQPRAVPADGATGVVLRVRVSDAQGLGDITAVTVDATGIGRGTLVLRDDGRHADGAPGDGVYGVVTSVAAGRAMGEQILLAVARDRAGNEGFVSLGALAILAAPGGAASDLPQRIGYGTNDWNEQPTQDWQGSTGVPWDYVYQYITYEWYEEGWGGDYVGRFVRYAWDRGYVPVVSVYMMLAVPPATGEGALQYAEKLQSPATVQQYFAALGEAARQARGTRPVIFHLEPDFYGYMQSYTRSPDRPTGIRPDDPDSIVVALPAELNAAGYPDTLAGFGRRMVDLVHEQAPNALVAPHASSWATGIEPSAVAPAQVAGLARDTALFMEAMGGAESDLVFVEWSDRDAGSGIRPWWDDTDRSLPRPVRALLWQNALSRAAGKRLMLWQVPVGHMALDNTCGRYRDNRAAYAFRQPRALWDSGVLAVLFGAGAQCMTTPSSDGGVLREQAAAAYASPSAPSDLVLDAVGEYDVLLRWQGVTDADLWGYRVRLSSRDGHGVVDWRVGPATSARVPVPQAGTWDISVAAYDAMDHLSADTATVRAATTLDAPGRLYMPLVQR